MKKIDVVVQSFNKPESLIYTLLTLHENCEEYIDTVWINDDQSDLGVVDKYINLKDSNILRPWTIKTRVNRKRMGWWVSFCRGRIPNYASWPFLIKRMAWNLYKNKTIFVEPNDIRYQWAIENTEKDHLLVIHDDVEFIGNVTKLLLGSVENQTNTGIVGDLGQCWRCRFKEEGCTPEKILQGIKPDVIWPKTMKEQSDHKWACRVNEWVALLNVHIAKEIAEKQNIFFGNYDDNGDIGAYWFSRLVALGYSFDDPFIREKQKYYKHWDGGITGHSAWVDQGDGKNTYDPDALRKRIKMEFGYEL
jgi:hypothetical protein